MFNRATANAPEIASCASKLIIRYQNRRAASACRRCDSPLNVSGPIPGRRSKSLRAIGVLTHQLPCFASPERLAEARAFIHSALGNISGLMPMLLSALVNPRVFGELSVVLRRYSIKATLILPRQAAARLQAPASNLSGQILARICL